MLTPPARRVLLAALALGFAGALVSAGSSIAQETPGDTTGVSHSPADTGSSEVEKPSHDADEPPASGGAPSSQEAAKPASGDAAQNPTSAEVPSGPRSDLSVLRAYVCRGVEQSEPTEAGKSFIPAPAGVLHLCCFSEIGGPARQDTVLHVWFWGEREMARVRLGVKGPRWRTWSTKRVLDEWRGEWHVDITDRAGVLLSRLCFSVE